MDQCLTYKSTPISAKRRKIDQSPSATPPKDDARSEESNDSLQSVVNQLIAGENAECAVEWICNTYSTYFSALQILQSGAVPYLLDQIRLLRGGHVRRLLELFRDITLLELPFECPLASSDSISLFYEMIPNSPPNCTELLVLILLNLIHDENNGRNAAEFSIIDSKFQSLLNIPIPASPKSEALISNIFGIAEGISMMVGADSCDILSPFIEVALSVISDASIPKCHYSIICCLSAILRNKTNTEKALNMDAASLISRKAQYGDDDIVSASFMCAYSIAMNAGFVREFLNEGFTTSMLESVICDNPERRRSSLKLLSLFVIDHSEQFLGSDVFEKFISRFSESQLPEKRLAAWVLFKASIFSDSALKLLDDSSIIWASLPFLSEKKAIFVLRSLKMLLDTKPQIRDLLSNSQIFLSALRETSSSEIVAKASESLIKEYFTEVH